MWTVLKHESIRSRNEKNEDSLLDQNMTVFRDKSRRSVKLEGILRVKVFAIKAKVSIYWQFWTVQFYVFFDRQLYYFWSFTWTILNRLLPPFNILVPFKKPSTIVLDPPFLMQMTVQFGLRTKNYFWHNYVVYLTLLLIALNYKVQWHFPTYVTNLQTSARTFQLQRNFPTSAKFSNSSEIFQLQKKLSYFAWSFPPSLGSFRGS